MNLTAGQKAAITRRRNREIAKANAEKADKRLVAAAFATTLLESRAAIFADDLALSVHLSSKKTRAIIRLILTTQELS